MRFFRSFRIWREKSGVIGPDSYWCCVYDGIPGYLHTANSLSELVWQLLTEFRNDKHLVGY